jgi:hypothetical protein
MSSQLTACTTVVWALLLVETTIPHIICAVGLMLPGAGLFPGQQLHLTTPQALPYRQITWL